MEKHPVALIPIATYDQAAVDTAVLQGVDLLGGIARFVQPEERVLLKPNLLSRALPQKAITTHPAVFSAVCRLLRESGYTHLSYGDSPGNPTTSPDKAAQASGIAEAAKRYGVEMADFFSGSVVPFPDGHTAKSFYLCKGVQDADAMINICKMKTHALERITGAVKNLYGCITGVNKAAGLGFCGYADRPAPLRPPAPAHHGWHHRDGRQRPNLRHADCHECAALLRRSRCAGHGVCRAHPP